MASLGKRLKKARKEAGYSLTQVEARTGITNGYLSLLERDKKNNPSLDKLEKLAELYNVNLSYFLAPEKTLEALSKEEKEFFEEMLKNKQIKTLFREVRGMTDNDLARIIQIAKAWNQEKK